MVYFVVSCLHLPVGADENDVKPREGSRSLPRIERATTEWKYDLASIECRRYESEVSIGNGDRGKAGVLGTN